MGLAYCKALCTSKSKTKYTFNNELNANISHNRTAGQQQPATASEYQVTTIQNAVELQGKGL
jgi:hypothetical protein